jgi:Glycosyl hydrolase family 12
VSRTRRALAFTPAVLAVTLLLAGCGSSAPLGAGVVKVVPTPPGTADLWRWNARCTLAPAATTGCRKAGPILGFAQLNGDAWNLGGPASAGSVDMSVASSGAVSIEGRFARTPPCRDSACLAPSANTWVRGYPNVLYGIDQCRADTSPRSSPRLPLPIRLDSIPPHLIGVTAYSFRTSRVTYDVAYDLWLNLTGTKRPCRNSGTLEIVVMTDYGVGALPPDSLRVGTAEIPFAVGQAARSGAQPWSIYATNIGRDGWTAAWGGTLWIVPGPADVVHEGRVSVDLSAVLSAAGRLLHDTYGWRELARHYWLDTAAFGIEFGPPSGNPVDSGPSHVSARISAYCLAVRTALLDATCG